MKTLIPALLVFDLFYHAQSAIFLEPQPAVPGHPGECYDLETNTYYQPGQEMVWRGDECARKLCRGSYGKREILTEIQTCGKIIAPPDCFIPNDRSEPYPDCCRIECPDSDEHSNTV